MDAIEYWAAPRQEDRGTRKRVETPSVLVVDDDPAFRELLTEFLWDAGYKVVEAVDGLDAFEMADQSLREIDLAIVDLHMPRMSGLEFAEQIKALSVTLPIVTMSAFPDARFYRSSYELGCAAAFAKPFSFFEFIEYVNSLFDR